MSAYGQLRDEVNGFQASRAELFKWKFVLVGTAMAAGLGFSERAPMGSAWVLILVPGLALYCDLLILDYDSRIAVIAAFLRHVPDSDVHSAYEEYIAQKEFARAWIFGRVALWLSTASVCVLVVVYGLYLRTIPRDANIPPALVTVADHWWGVVFGGCCWCIALAALLALWKTHLETIRRAEPNVSVLERLRRDPLKHDKGEIGHAAPEVRW